MKKLFIALASVVMLAACAGSGHKNYNIAYIGLSDEEKTLFESEIGADDASYLQDLAEKYTIGKEAMITVSKQADTTSITGLCSYDQNIASATLKLLKDYLPGTTDQMLDSFDGAKYDFVDDFSCAGMYYDFGEHTMAYMIFCDEVSYTILPMKRDVVEAWTKARKGEAAYANHSEVDLRVMMGILQLVNGEVPFFLGGISKTLSTGQKVRINFTAELK